MICELVVEALPDPLARRRAVAVADRALAAGAEQDVGGRPRRPTSVELGETQLELREVHLAQAEVGARVEGAPVGDRAGAGQQVASLALVSPASPASRQISSAISCICLPDLRKPSALPRSTWRRSRATSRRAASRTSTVGASSRSA